MGKKAFTKKNKKNRKLVIQNDLLLRHEKFNFLTKTLITP